MRTITTNIYSFNELSETAKQKAIENVRNSYYVDNEFLEWAIDDCCLLEPPHEELATLFGDKYKFPLLKNNRKAYCSLDRDRYIDISNAMEVTNEVQFLTWLGLGSGLISKVDYTIKADSIEICSYDDLSESEIEAIEDAVEKFEDHCQTVLNRIETSYEYRFTDEAIIEDIEANEVEFLMDGTIY